MDVVIVTSGPDARAPEGLLAALSARRAEVQIVHDTAGALAAWKTDAPALIFVDDDLDEAAAGAIARCTELAARPALYPPLLVALVSAESRDRIDALLDAGASDFLEKPLVEPCLSARLRILAARLEAEATMREAEDKFRSLVGNIPGVVYRSVADRRGRELGGAGTARRTDFLSDHIGILSGFDAAEFADGSRTYASMVHPDDADHVARAIEAASQTREAFDIEYRIRRADGTTRWVTSRGRARYGPDGEFRSLDGVILDVTEDKLARERLAGANDALRRLDEQKARMFQNVTHELRTPLTLILGPLEEILAHTSLTPEDRGRHESMRRNALRLLGLINDMLDLAKLESAAVPVRARPVDVVRFVELLLADVLPAAEAKSLALRFQATGGSARYRLDPAHLERIVLNLVANAFKFTPPGGSVEVGVAEDPAGLSIRIDDTGIGIPAEATARIFRRFEQVDGTATRERGGTGIGLSLALELTRLLGGTLSVDSTVGVGSRFEVRFPGALRTDDADADLAPESERGGDIGRRAALALLEAAARPALRREGGARGPFVLVAEDDPGIAAQLFDLLVTRYQVVVVPDGEEALSVAQARTPHVVVSDVMMPRMDGLRLAAALRERPSFRDTAIVLLSARGELEDRVRGRQVGVDTYLAKPFHPEEVLATIEGLLRARMRVVGSFFLQEELGSGGQGTVWRAEHLLTGASAALKLVDARADDTATRRLLQREQESLARIVHPNVVRIFEHGEHESRFYVAMEYLRGTTLQARLAREGPLPPAAVRGIACAVCGALEAVHRSGLLHRDIKPSNIMLLDGAGTIRERVRVIDFGAALDVESMRADEQLVGSLHYLAPEILSGEAPTPRSDIYALGVAMFTLLAGAWPHGSDDAAELLAEILAGPPSLRERAPAVSVGLEAVVLRAIDPSTSRRWDSARELRQALEVLPLGPESLVPPPRVAPDATTMSEASEVRAARGR